MSYTIDSYLDKLKSADPTPGGGSVAALEGALGASLVMMVANLSQSKKIYKEATDEAKADYDKKLAEIDALQVRLRRLTDLDCEAYSLVAGAFKMSKEDPSRPAKIQDALKLAASTPYETCERVLEGMYYVEYYLDKTIKAVITDLACACSLFASAFYGAELNVKINLEGMDDEAYVKACLGKLEKMGAEVKAFEERINANVNSKMKF